MKVPFVSFLPMERELNDALRGAFDRVFDRSWYIEGVEDEAFEKAFARYCGTEYCVGVGNGLDALMLALKALGIGEGDEVIVPSNTYIATALAATYVGATPVFVEPVIDTFNIDPARIEVAITPRTKAIMPVHLYGRACDMDPIMELANKYDLTVLEDAAHAFGATYKGRKIGNIAHFTCFSLHEVKNCTSFGEGGIVTTTIDEMKAALEGRPRFVKAMWCGDEKCEEAIKEMTGMPSRCMPFAQEKVGDVCPVCGKPADKMVIFGIAY